MPLKGSECSIAMNYSDQYEENGEIGYLKF